METVLHSQIGKGRQAGGFLILLVLLLLLFLTGLATGSVHIPWTDVLSILTGESAGEEVWQKILLEIRLPRTLTAILAGSALAVSGLLMQTLFRNPLAGPSVLGITSGASLGVAAFMMAGGGGAGFLAARQLGIAGSWGIVLSATAGAALVMLLILLVSFRVRDNVALLIIGLMIGNLTLSAVSIWQYFSAPEQIRDYVMWTFGSLGGVSPDQLRVLVPVLIAGLVASAAGGKILNAFLLGEDYARSLGVNVIRGRWMVIALTSLLAGTVTGFCGPVAFIGIAVPHIARNVFHSSNHHLLLPACALTGAVLLLACDILAQVPGSSISLPINAITALLGSPVVVYVVVRGKSNRQAF